MMVPSDSGSVQRRVQEVGEALATAISRVLGSLPGGPHRPQSLAKRLSLNAVLTSRLLKAAQQSDPIAVVHSMPGPEPLRRLLRAAEKQKVNRELINAAAAAVDRFQQLIDAEAGDRSALDALISAWLPEARQTVELNAKQAAFRGISHLLGTTSDASHFTYLVHPSANHPDRADEIRLMNTRGLRRVRPGNVANFDTVHSAEPMFNLKGEPAGGMNSHLLEQFCTQPLPPMQVSQQQGVTQTLLSDQEVGLRAAVDLVHAMYLPAKRSITMQDGQAATSLVMAVGIDTPTRVFIFDVYLYRDLFRGLEPHLNIYRTAGVFDGTPAHRRDIDRLALLESVQTLGFGVAAFRSLDTPNHQETLRFACAQRGWDIDQFRGWRCRIEYPMYSSEIVVSFKPKP